MVSYRGIAGALGGCCGPNYAQLNGPNFGLLIICAPCPPSGCGSRARLSSSRCTRMGPRPGCVGPCRTSGHRWPVPRRLAHKRLDKADDRVLLPQCVEQPGLVLGQGRAVGRRGTFAAEAPAA